jgi:hypothetical protein
MEIFIGISTATAIARFVQIVNINTTDADGERRGGARR